MENPKMTQMNFFGNLKDIRFGSIEIIIHDSKIVQIERKEKFRLDTTSIRPDQ